jgi:hypothetical protein
VPAISQITVTLFALYDVFQCVSLTASGQAHTCWITEAVIYTQDYIDIAIACSDSSATSVHSTAHLTADHQY